MTQLASKRLRISNNTRLQDRHNRLLTFLNLLSFKSIYLLWLEIFIQVLYCYAYVIVELNIKNLYDLKVTQL